MDFTTKTESNDDFEEQRVPVSPENLGSETGTQPKARSSMLERPPFRIGTAIAVATIAVEEVVKPTIVEAFTGALSSSPSSATLPNTNVNSITSTSLTLTNTLSSGDVTVTGRIMGGTDAASFLSLFTSGTVIGPGQTASLGVTFLPTSAGTYTAQLFINYTAPSGSNSLAITLMGTALSSGGSGVASDTSDPGFTGDSDSDPGDSSDTDCGCCTPTMPPTGT